MNQMISINLTEEQHSALQRMMNASHDLDEVRKDVLRDGFDEGDLSELHDAVKLDFRKLGPESNLGVTLDSPESVTVINALRIAAKIYEDDALMIASQRVADSLSKQFGEQSREASRLAYWIEEQLS